MSNHSQAIGAYSVYKECGNLVFISGQLPVNPSSGEIKSDDIQAQTKQSLENIGEILKEQNLSFDNVVKTLVFISDINNFAAMNETYGTFFKAPYPARSCVAVKDIPKGALVEIEAIAYRDKF